MGKYCFGVDVGGTTVKLGLFNTSGDLMEKWEIPTVTEDDGKAILPDCAKSILKKMDERKMDRTEVVGVGIGAPGPVDSEGTLYGAVNLGWGTMSLKKELQTLLNMPVEAGNDANVAALGEAWQGGAKGYEDVVVVTLGTGVGGGIIINGKMVAGATGAAGEIGHMHVNDDETEPSPPRGGWRAPRRTRPATAPAARMCLKRIGNRRGSVRPDDTGCGEIRYLLLSGGRRF